MMRAQPVPRCRFVVILRGGSGRRQCYGYPAPGQTLCPLHIAETAKRERVAAALAARTFKPSGECTCASDGGPCETCEANRSAYDEFRAEQSAKAAP